MQLSPNERFADTFYKKIESANIVLRMRNPQLRLGNVFERIEALQVNLRNPQRRFPDRLKTIVGGAWKW